MNADLLIGEDLKKTGAGNLFTVFGEPDIELRSTDDGGAIRDRSQRAMTGLWITEWTSPLWMPGSHA